MVDLTPLNLTDSLIGEFSEPSCFCTFSSNFNSEDIQAWLSNLQTLLTNLNFHIASSVIGLPYLFHSLVHQTFYNVTLRGMKEFSSGLMDERKRRMKEFSNGLTTMVQQEY